jgi:hypothetical protein
VAAYLAPEMDGLEQEQLRVVLLDARNQIRRVVLVYQGTANCTRVHLADCFREAVREGATAIVVVHNHPSGDPRPSPVIWRICQGHGGRTLSAAVGDVPVVPVGGEGPTRCGTLAISSSSQTRPRCSRHRSWAPAGDAN